MPKLLPSRTKFRKTHKGRVRGVASRETQFLLESLVYSHYLEEG